jgi:hypothetical protein
MLLLNRFKKFKNIISQLSIWFSNLWTKKVFSLLKKLSYSIENRILYNNGHIFIFNKQDLTNYLGKNVESKASTIFRYKKTNQIN